MWETENTQSQPFKINIHHDWLEQAVAQVKLKEKNASIAIDFDRMIECKTKIKQNQISNMCFTFTYAKTFF